MTDYFLTATARTKRAAEIKPFTIDLKRILRSYWLAGRAYNSGDVVRSPSVSGFAFQALNAGEAAAFEPPWPRVLYGTCIDASLNWLAVPPGVYALDYISAAPVWSQIAPPDGALTIPSSSNTNEETSAAFAVGTAGNTYRINCAVSTIGGNLYVVQFDLEVG